MINIKQVEIVLLYCVYAIGIKENLNPPYEKCYIGVTSNLTRRWKKHTQSSYTIGKYIRQHKLNQQDNFIVIFEGTEDECFLVEEIYRPSPNIGLNEASGGKGGYTVYNKERNEKISLKVKESRKRKIWTTHKNRRCYSGKNNPNARKWMLIDKNRNIYNVKGSLSDFCEENSILESCLRRYIGDVVPPPNFSGYGGYRAKNNKSKILRLNTTGWTLIKADNLPGGVL